jgi:hypothetical protein
MKHTALALTLPRANLCLQAGYGLSLTDAAGVELTTRTGKLWVTLENDPRDVNLKAGDAYTIERDGLTLISALEPSLVQVRMPQRGTSWLERLERWLARAWAFLVRAAEIRARARLTRGYRSPV